MRFWPPRQQAHSCMQWCSRLARTAARRKALANCWCRCRRQSESQGWWNSDRRIAARSGRGCGRWLGYRSRAASALSRVPQYRPMVRLGAHESFQSYTSLFSQVVLGLSSAAHQSRPSSHKLARESPRGTAAIPSSKLQNLPKSRAYLARPNITVAENVGDLARLEQLRKLGRNLVCALWNMEVTTDKHELLRISLWSCMWGHLPR